MIARVSRQTVDAFQEPANQCIENANELKDAVEELRGLEQQLRAIIAKCNSSIGTLNSDSFALSKVLKELKMEHADVCFQLIGMAPSLKRKALVIHRDFLASKISSLDSLMARAQSLIAKLSRVVTLAENALSLIENYGDRLEMMANKLAKQSEEVAANLTKIKRIISTYLSVSFSFAAVSDIKSLFSLGENKYGRMMEKTKNNNVQIFCRREELAGMNHPTTGIPYERFVVTYSDGVTREIVAPKFPYDFQATLPPEMYTARERIKGGQFEECTRQLKEAIQKDWRLKKKFTPEQLDQIDHLITPRGYTWHHEPIEGKISLVLTSIHKQTGHTGGRNLWGGGSNMR